MYKRITLGELIDKMTESCEAVVAPLVQVDESFLATIGVTYVGSVDTAAPDTSSLLDFDSKCKDNNTTSVKALGQLIQLISEERGQLSEPKITTEKELDETVNDEVGAVLKELIESIHNEAASPQERPIEVENDQVVPVTPVVDTPVVGPADVTTVQEAPPIELVKQEPVVPESPKEEEQVVCGSCDDYCNKLNVLICNSDHVMCEICTESYLKMVFAEPNLNLPLKCQKCQDELRFDTVEQQLSLHGIDSVKFMNLVAKHTLEANNVNNEILAECPFCNYFEIRDSIGINFVFCKNPECSKTSCYYCHLECKANDGCSDCEDDMTKHFECAVDFNIKKQIDNAIENGLKVHCPHCNTAGRKDEDTCTHMACIKCDRYYCYVCGLATEDFEGVDTDYDTDYFSIHNSEWSSIETRCPMYFGDIISYDNRWPDTGYESDLLNYFHRKRIITNLRYVFRLNSIETIRELENKYGWLKKADFDIDEILDDDLILIQRS